MNIFLKIRQDGHALVLNYNDEPAIVSVAGADVTVEPFRIERVKLRAE